MSLRGLHPVCECSNDECEIPVPITWDQYNALSKHGYICFPGHSIHGGEDLVIASTNSYMIIADPKRLDGDAE